MFTFAWDVDDVLNDLMGAWFAHQDTGAGGTVSLQYEDLTENPPHRLLAMSQSEYLESLDVFRSEQYAQLTPVAPVYRWFEAYGNPYRHIALTAVPFAAVSASASWVMAHYGRWIRTYHYVPSHRPYCSIPDYDRSKGEFLQWMDQVDCLVDDNENNVQEARSLGRQAVLFPRPWNTARDQSIEEVLSNLLTLTTKLK